VARFTAAGIPAFNYGPGLPDLCHRADEYCPVDNLGTGLREPLPRSSPESA
jgi:acetylornithine deacetylase/succinyl-diaminopimelate desuccinylase-like protein